jgi:hypothetical protein
MAVKKKAAPKKKGKAPSRKKSKGNYAAVKKGRGTGKKAALRSIAKIILEVNLKPLLQHLLLN